MMGCFARDKNRGFTLVELAVVMIIIGLLIGGILKGQEMIRNARIKATMAQYQGLLGAHHTFRDVYGTLPGDMANAQARLPNCTAANFCVGGDGNGQLGTRINNTTDIATTAGVQENIQYWKHLALADLITGVIITASNAPAASAWGASHPRAEIGAAGWNAIMTDPAGAGDYGGPGIILQITGTPNINDVTVRPHIAAHIDRELDDGRPNTGTITAEYSTITNCDDDTTNAYLENRTDGGAGCIMYFQVN